ncbi:MAG: hypothetical protein HYV78_02255, partial [Candidatus Wildermuthbacteria bacterium]|nr:hypothetical protein [Candidatus Wildermuthbacteria bacterium]
DKFQEIKDVYPRLHAIEPPTFQLRSIYSLIEKKSWGKDLILQLNKRPIPLVCTFFAQAFMAEYWGYKGQIYLLGTDSDLSRAWAPIRPHKTKIQYLAPTKEAGDRLVSYGVPQSQVFVTVFPLPLELTGSPFAPVARFDTLHRLSRLDPKGIYMKKYAGVLKQYLHRMPPAAGKSSVPAVTFAIGGAGGQVEIAQDIIEGLAPLLKKRAMRLYCIAGAHKDIAKTLLASVKGAGLQSVLSKSVCIESANTKAEYFREFNRIMRRTDILWTKPSELVFFAGLGIPLCIAPPVGSQEVFNRKWLLQIGAGVDQLNPKHASEWLPDLIQKGVFARAAMQGFVEIEKRGLWNIQKIIKNR